MTAFYQGKTLQRNQENAFSSPQANILQMEKSYIEKLTVAQNIFHRIKNYTSELEILVLGIIKIYCGSDFSEKNRVEFLLQNIQNELKDFENRTKSTNPISERHTSPKNLKILNPSMSDSLLSSTLSDNSTMLAIKNDVKGLINEYKEAVDRLKAENATIHSLVAAKKQFGQIDDDYISNRYERKKTNASVDYNRSPQRIISDKSVNNYDTLGSQLRGEEMKRLEKYAELDKYIDELNRKKEENLQRLATVENRLHTIRRTIPDEDSGILKTSDLSKEDEKPVYHSSRKKEVLRENNLNVANKAHRSQRGGETNSKYIEYLKNIDRRENKNLSKPSEREKSYRSGSKRKVQNENINDSHVLEDEIGELNKEIEMIRNLLDSAMLQRKYQSK